MGGARRDIYRHCTNIVAPAILKLVSTSMEPFSPGLRLFKSYRDWSFSDVLHPSIRRALTFF